MKIRWLIVLVLFLAGCSSHTAKQPVWDPTKPVQRALTWMPLTEQAGEEWSVSPRVITAIIAVESGGNPALVSKSNAVGLMQIKASTAGADVYRHLGWSGQPSTGELKDPARNISIGTAYLSIMEHGILAGIEDPQTMQYALLVSYANGAGALLRTFSSDRKKAISEINSLSPDEFWEYVAKNHPAAQAPRYLYKVSRAMEAM
ncbi:membrane-bound lytic murein transglycosylase EmtA [Cedecea colo]|uniref:Endo-type membrane-bound lytic murein transglycosylase A n=1 Tax=Cedecea colo TaxID=2552946 RepID=A0ABX0VJM7_9ENTR|nr:membrane-bound lytic murein transglycosylase EmtA [Cedecea colo]